jgi:hypothetical protein
MVLVCGSVLGLSRLAQLARHSRLPFAGDAEISFDLCLRPSGWELQLFARCARELFLEVIGSIENEVSVLRHD